MNLPRLLIALAVVAAVVGAALVLRPLDSPEPTAAPPSSTVLHAGGSAHACIAVSGSDDSCERQALDSARRTQLTAQERAEVVAKAPAVESLFPPLPTKRPTCSSAGSPCRADYGPVDSTYVANAWSVVFRAGYEDAVVRVARAEDPAPAGTMIYGSLPQRTREWLREF
ncbi:hypothetical protein LWC34_16535 [Kibdelosporangium philippinense]|uniref:Uncharacterized protein n=1 Tax=Kibdelosporangium philippinense TaxID=211113 RepID=A0ABS8Z9D1_9PSEU|nr:hypothetical protein [Kibdelosporangium philippinense]MCE7004430.1 hypothetical protein [Kibdelosporangium philippinense]